MVVPVPLCILQHSGYRCTTHRKLSYVSKYEYLYDYEYKYLLQSTIRCTIACINRTLVMGGCNTVNFLFCLSMREICGKAAFGESYSTHFCIKTTSRKKE